VPPTPSIQFVAGFDLLLDGAPAPEDLLAGLTDMRVEDNLMLPDSCTLRFATKEAEVDLSALGLKIGKTLELKLKGAHQEGAPQALFKGDLVSVEPEFGPERTMLGVRAYDRSHRLNRERKTRTFQDVTYDDVAKKIAGEAGLSVEAESAPGGTHKFVQQSGETDWLFLWRIAGRIGFEVYVVDEKLHFRKLGSAKGGVTLKLGETLIGFRPRLTGAQQVKEVQVRGWDPVQKEAIVGDASSHETLSKPGIQRSEVEKAFGGNGKVLVGNAPVETADEARAMAESVLAKLADAYVEADGDAVGDPGLRAGATVTIEGVGSDFSGDYTLTSSVHAYSAERGYYTRFRISGRTQRTLLDLMTPAHNTPWANGLVIGIVTNNQDPEKLGRVRVKFPTLDDSLEGWWARVTALNAGKERGVLMVPQVGDEVVVGFEHGDPTRPFVLGSVWNSPSPPTDMDAPEGNFELRSDEKVTVKAKKDVTIETDGKIIGKATGDIEVEGQKITIKGGADINIEASGSATVSATGQLTLKGMGVSVDGGGGVVKVSGSQIMLG
jgi:uncharacterized protein involved in type VI secretion and phage assembly